MQRRLEAEIPFGGSRRRRRGGLFRVRPLSVATLLTCDQSGMRLGEGEKARKTKKWNIHDQKERCLTFCSVFVLKVSIADGQFCLNKHNSGRAVNVAPAIKSMLRPVCQPAWSVSLAEENDLTGIYPS